MQTVADTGGGTKSVNKLDLTGKFSKNTIQRYENENDSDMRVTMKDFQFKHLISLVQAKRI